jgi:hypothetical protein
LGAEGGGREADGSPQATDGALGRLAQEGFQLGEGVLDRIEVWGIRRQVEQLGASGFDRLADARSFVAAEVVHDDDVAWLQLGRQHLLDISLEGDAVDRPIENQGCHHPCRAQAGNEGRGLPVGMRDGGTQALTPGSATVRSGHLGRGPGLIDKHQAFGIEVELPFEPVPASFQDVGPLLLGRMRCLYGMARP